MDYWRNYIITNFYNDYSDSLLLCDGTSYSRTEYNNLYSIIGTYYGSENSSTFKIPNLKMAQSVSDENKYYIRGRNNMTTIYHLLFLLII